MRWLLMLTCAVAAGCVSSGRSPAEEPAAPQPQDEVLFRETFEDTNWAARGWYDGPAMRITKEEHAPGSSHACVWHWTRAGDIAIEGRGARVHLRPVTNVTLSYWIKHSPDWTWTGVNWHPHEFHFITDADPEYVGPAYTHLTLYAEAVNGRPRVAIQDGMNIDETRLGQDLVGVTENRSVAGGNGDSDGHGKGDCYVAGGHHVNGKFWETKEVHFTDTPGPHYKGDWHRIRVHFRLNTVRDGIGQRDGVIRYWYDDKLIMDFSDIVFRTGAHPHMKINQFLMTPYYGPGVPHEQSIWVDDLLIATDATP